MKILLVGYYGMGNIGDDLMLQSLLPVLASEPFIESITVSCNKNYYPLFPKTRFIPNCFTGTFNKFFAMLQADIVCWGGGTCIFDNPGMYRLLTRLKICEIFRKPFAFLGIGIGSLETNESKKAAFEILTRADFVSFRDDESLFIARNTLGYQGASVVCGDLASLGWRNLSTAKPKLSWKGEMSFSGVCNQGAEVAEHWGKQLARLVVELGIRINFLPAHTQCTDDNIFHRTIASYLNPDSYIIHSLATPFKFLHLLNQMDFHIGMRLHSVIIADILGVPNIAIEYSPKVAFYIRKSAMLVDERLVQLQECICSDRVHDILKRYKRPEEFLDSEEQSARKSLDALFRKVS